MVNAIFLLALVLLCGKSFCQNQGAPNSPCPNIFQYVQDQNGGWQGRVSIIPPIQFSEVKLQLKLTVNYFPLSAGVGGITFKGGKQEIQAISDTASRNQRQQINYVINFPPGPPPRVAQVVINNKEFCPNVPSYPDTRGEINLRYNLKTGLTLAAVGGDEFTAPGNGINVAPDATRLGAATYISKPIATEDPADYQQPSTYRPSIPAYKQATTRNQPQPTPELATITVPSPDSQQHHDTAVTPKVSTCLENCKQRADETTSSLQGKYSIKCFFDPNRELPDEANVHLWIRDTLRLQKEQVEEITLQRKSRLVYIVVDKRLVSEIVNNFTGSAEFRSLDGQYIYDVKLSAHLHESVGDRKVRVLNLPVEVTDQVIRMALSEFGQVNNISNERWSSCFHYSVNNGVRIVSMNLDKHIPQRSLLFENHRGVVMYEGQPNPCNCYEKVKSSEGCQNGTGSGLNNVNTPSV